MPQWPWRKPRPGVDAYGRSPLWHAAMQGDLAEIRRLVKAGADPTAADKDGYTALHVAAQEQQLEAARMLLAAGADVNAVDRHGNGPLWTAGYGGGREHGPAIIALYLSAGADPRHVNRHGRSPLAWANSAAVRDVFLAAGVSPGELVASD